MEYINVGALVNGKRPATKKALKSALAVDPSVVKFDVTSMMFNASKGSYSALEIPRDVTLSVCGPDPYTSRKWFASVSRGERGIKVT